MYYISELSAHYTGLCESALNLIFCYFKDGYCEVV